MQGNENQDRRTSVLQRRTERIYGTQRDRPVAAERSDVSVADISADSDRSVVSLMARRIRRLQFAQNSTESDEIDVRGGKGEGLRGGTNAGVASREERRSDSGAER